MDETFAPGRSSSERHLDDSSAPARAAGQTAFGRNRDDWPVSRHTEGANRRQGASRVRLSVVGDEHLLLRNRYVVAPSIADAPIECLAQSTRQPAPRVVCSRAPGPSVAPRPPLVLRQTTCHRSIGLSAPEPESVAENVTSPGFPGCNIHELTGKPIALRGSP